MANNPQPKSPPKLVMTRWGYYQYTPLPSDEELSEYYAKKYYQQGKGSYSTIYNDEEIEYFKLKSRLVYLKTRQLLQAPDTGTMLDVGCGEGWLLDTFHQQGHEVLGLDYSRFSIEKFHPHLLPYFKSGNLYESLNDIIAAGRKYHYVILANIIEHVKDPVRLLEDISKIMADRCILIIVAPNDFSELHNHLIDKKRISRKFWLCYPDHLSYFNKQSMINLISDIGFTIHSVVADNPVDLNLLNDSTNYVDNPDTGKNIHMYRVRHDNFIAKQDEAKLLQLYEIMGSMGIGRDLSFYCSKV